MKRRLAGLCLLLYAGFVMAIEEPSYEVIEQTGNFELRVYPPMIVAETLVAGSMNAASNAGFRAIAGYIFGGNTSQSGAPEKISMTSPVTMKPASEKIDMTAPVSTQAADGQWRVQFVMPGKYTMETLPTPDNPAVDLRELQEAHYAVLRFSGLVGERNMQKKIAELMQWVREKGIRPDGTPELARYDPPWTLPFLRRNEIMIRYQPE